MNTMDRQYAGSQPCSHHAWNYEVGGTLYKVETGGLTGLLDRPSNASIARWRGYEGLGRVRSTLHRPQSVVLCLNPAAKHLTFLKRCIWFVELRANT